MKFTPRCQNKGYDRESHLKCMGRGYPESATHTDVGGVLSPNKRFEEIDGL